MATIINSSTSNGLVMTPDTSGEIELQANGVTKAKVTANGLQDANGNSLRGGMYRNLIINGDMRIAQRGSSLATTNSEGYIIDRYLVGSFNGNTVTYSQNTDVPSGYGFTNSMKVTNTTGTAASTFETICQRMEGLITSQLDFGSASAKQITLSFWVKSSVTGTYNVGFKNSANNRGYVADYTISSANTWEKKSITITGDTTGTWLTTNGIGIRTFFVLGASAGNSTTPNAWSASANMGSSNLSNTWTTTSGATFYITGVQLEVGSGASDFEFLPYDVQLTRCQRYYEKSFVIETAPADGVYTQAYLANVPYIDQWVLCAPYIPFKVEKRVTPTVVYYGSSGKWQVNNTSNSWVTFAAVYSTGQGSSGINAKGMSVTVHNNGDSGYAVSSARTIRGDWTASAEL